ncbi:SNF2-related protein, partial [Candidatus Liberibacter asiaticus]
MLLNLAPHQTKIVDWILDHKRCAIWASMGSGKTVSVLTALSYIHLWGEKSVLVIAPLRVAQSVWTSEVQRWSNFSHMNISVITGTVKQRTKVLKTPAVLYVINFENLGWLVQELKGTWPFATIVVDESTKLKSFRLRQGSKTARALAKPAWESERFIELTGTPSPNGLIDLWGQIWFLDKGKRLGRVFQSFVARW